MNAGWPIVPGLQGFGVDTFAGRKGPDVFVDNLHDDSPAPPGSLRAAVRQPGPRRIIPRVEGRVHLVRPMKWTSGDCTYRGDLAPGEGLTTSGDEHRFQAPNMAIVGLKSRMGDERVPTDGADNGDAANFGDPDLRAGVYNVVLHKCSLMFSSDEVCTAWHEAHDLTISHCIIGWAMWHSFHPKGAHAMGHLFGSGPNPLTGVQTFTTRISSHHNLVANCDQRMPQMSETGDVDFRGNVVYNWGIEPCALEKPGGPAPLGLKRVNLFRNYWKPGPNRGDWPTCVRIASNGASAASDTRLFIAENWGPVGDTVVKDRRFDNWNYLRLDNRQMPPEEVDGIRYRLDQPFPCPRVYVLPVEQNYEYVLANCGARRRVSPRERLDPVNGWAAGLDEIDRKFVQTVRDDAGYFVDSPSRDPRIGW